jgi:hypothetical protein
MLPKWRFGWRARSIARSITVFQVAAGSHESTQGEMDRGGRRHTAMGQSAPRGRWEQWGDSARPGGTRDGGRGERGRRYSIGRRQSRRVALSVVGVRDGPRNRGVVDWRGDSVRGWVSGLSWESAYANTTNGFISIPGVSIKRKTNKRPRRQMAGGPMGDGRAARDFSARRRREGLG